MAVPTVGSDTPEQVGRHKEVSKQYPSVVLPWASALGSLDDGLQAKINPSLPKIILVQCFITATEKQAVIPSYACVHTYTHTQTWMPGCAYKQRNRQCI